MNLYPFNLVLAVAISSATLFLGYQSTRLLQTDHFLRQFLRLGAAWLAVAAISPTTILHYHILLALLCFVAWWRLHGVYGLSGKLWLCAATGLGFSLGVVLILAVTPEAWPTNLSPLAEVLFLVSIYVSGMIVGLAYALHVFTRPAAIEAGVVASRQAALLWILVLIRAGVAIFMFLGFSKGAAAPPLSWKFLFTGEVSPVVMIGVGICHILVLPILGWFAWHRSRSPRPSTTGPIVMAIGGIGFAAEIVALCWTAGS